MDFIIDTKGNSDYENDNSTGRQGRSKIDELLKEYKESLVKQQQQNCGKKPLQRNNSNKPDIKDLCATVVWNNERAKQKPIEKAETSQIKAQVEEAMKKSIITSDFEQRHAVPPLEVCEKKLHEERRKEREKTKGKKWFGLPATEMTEEIKHDLEVLQMRSVLDPKRFYKKNDLKVIPKYFQIGTVMDSPLDYYSNRLTRKERKKTLVDELLANDEFKKYNKRKYNEIIEEKQKTHYKAWKQAKKLKKRKK